MARIVYADNNLLFTDVEDCRSTLRYIEGKRGAPLLKKVKHTEFYMTESRKLDK